MDRFADGDRDAGGDGGDGALPGEERREVGALEAGGGRQHEARIELRGGDADPGVGGDDILLGNGDVRPARQKLPPSEHTRGVTDCAVTPRKNLVELGGVELEGNIVIGATEDGLLALPSSGRGRR